MRAGGAEARRRSLSVVMAWVSRVGRCGQGLGLEVVAEIAAEIAAEVGAEIAAEIAAEGGAEVGAEIAAEVGAEGVPCGLRP